MIKVNGIKFNHYINEREVLAITEWNDDLGNANLDIYFKDSQFPQYITCKSQEERKKVIEEILKIEEKQI